MCDNENKESSDDEILFEVEKILKQRKNPKTGNLEYLLKWKGFSKYKSVYFLHFKPSFFFYYKH